MLQPSQPQSYSVPTHGPLHGLFTVLLILWAIAYPALIFLLGSFGLVGAILGLGAAILLFVPWLLGLVILGFVRWVS
jgi:hypothetical protein